MTGVADGLSDGLRERLAGVGLDPGSILAPGCGPWEIWLLLRDRWDARATLIDLYELEAVSLGIKPEALATSRPVTAESRSPAVWYPQREGGAVGVEGDRPVPLVDASHA